MPENDALLTARFGLDAIPLIHEFYRHALKLTHDHADAEYLLQETPARRSPVSTRSETAPIWASVPGTSAADRPAN